MSNFPIFSNNFSQKLPLRERKLSTEGSYHRFFREIVDEVVECAEPGVDHRQHVRMPVVHLRPVDVRRVANLEWLDGVHVRIGLDYGPVQQMEIMVASAIGT